MGKERPYLCLDHERCFVTEDITIVDGVELFWCRHTFPYRPIGCPISYKSLDYSNNIIVKLQKIIGTQESICKRQLDDCKEIHDNKFYTLEVQPSNYYLVDGLFCSFNCCFSFIQENKHNPLYSKSESLLKDLL